VWGSTPSEVFAPPIYLSSGDPLLIISKYFMRTLSSRYLSLGLGRKVAQHQASRLDEPVDAAIECEVG